jgi:PTH1 family peptidyl-tRNA hydrolase
MNLRSKSLIIKTEVEGRPLILAKPQTYMNLSGSAVQGLLHFYKIPFDHLLVAHDDLDLPFGSLRIRPGGGPGGQRGMVSTIERLGTRDFPRLRMGIGRPPGRMDPKDYVLQDFSREQEEFLPVILDRAAEAALEFVINGLNAAMNKHNKDYSQDSE